MSLLNSKENDILLLETQSKKFFQSPKSHILCEACKKPAKYQCPRCKVPYCDLTCYKAHNSECTELFYKDQVIQHLKGKKVTEAEMNKMKKLLHKYKDQDDEEQMPEIDEKILNKKLKRLNELKDMIDNKELTIEKLSIEEQMDFQNFVEERKEHWKTWKPYWFIEEVIYKIE